MDTPHTNVCLNCGAALTGKYCAECGQENIDYNVSLKHLIPEVLHEFFGFDSQIFASIPALLFKPGFLTNQFNEGKRTRYVSPLRMYLILSALFFFLDYSGDDKTQGGAPLVSIPAFDTLHVADTAHIGTPGSGVSDPAQTSDTTAAVDSSKPKFSFERKKRTFTIRSQSGELDSNSLAGHWIKSLIEKSIELKKNPGKFSRELSSNLATALFLMLPFVALFLKLLYLARKRLYIEHLIYVLHVHSFVFLCFAINEILSQIFHGTGPLVLFCFGLIVVAYGFLALKRVYRQSRGMAVVSYGILLFAYLGLLSIFSLGAVIASIYMA